MVLDISKQMSGWNTQSTRWSRLTKEQEDYILNASRERNETETWAMVDADKLAKKYLEQQKAEQRRNEWLQTGSNLFLLWMNAEDPDVKKTYMTGDRTQSLKNYFVNWAWENEWVDLTDTPPQEIFDMYTWANWKSDIVLWYLNWEIDEDTMKRELMLDTGANTSSQDLYIDSLIDDYWNPWIDNVSSLEYQQWGASKQEQNWRWDRNVKANNSVIAPIGRWVSAIWGATYWLGKWVLDALKWAYTSAKDISKIWKWDWSFWDKIAETLFWEIILDAIWGWLWDIMWDTIEWGWKWFTTQEERNTLSEGTEWITNAVSSWLNNMSPEERDEFWKILERGFEAFDLFTAWLWKFFSQPIKKWAETALKKWAEWVWKVIEETPILSQLWKEVDYMADKKLKSAVEKEIKNSEDIARAIVKWGMDDWENAVRVLKNLDLSDVKKPHDIVKKIDDDITKLVNDENKIIEQYWEWFNRADTMFDDVIEAWGASQKVWHDPVKEAIDAFTKRYADVPSKRAVFDIYSRKLAEWTLTRADILDIARWWSYEFWEKAFTKDWSLVKTISADRARDVWKDLKEVWKKWLDEADLKEIERLQEELVLRYWVKETAQAFADESDKIFKNLRPTLSEKAWSAVKAVKKLKNLDLKKADAYLTTAELLDNLPRYIKKFEKSQQTIKNKTAAITKK